MNGVLGCDTIQVTWKLGAESELALGAATATKQMQDQLGRYPLEFSLVALPNTTTSQSPLVAGHLLGGAFAWGDSVPADTQAPTVANPESGLGGGFGAPLAVSSPRFTLLGVGRWGNKAPTFIFSETLPGTFTLITSLIW